LKDANKGFGKHAWDVPPENDTILRQLYYVSGLFYVIAENISKISILLTYLRIFPSDSFRLVTKVALVLIPLRTLAFFIADALQCIPINSIWDLNLQAKCISSTGLILSGAAFNIVDDVVLILMPIPELRSLNLSIKKRAALIFMFAVGSLYFPPTPPQMQL
jgi:hypothetical protein